MNRSSERRMANRGPVVPPRFDTYSVGPPVAPPRGRSREIPDRKHGERVPPRQERESQPSGGVYVISVVARLLEMHPQTLRKYERLGLVIPTRSLGMLRLYSAEDIVRVRLIKHLVDNLGMNLAGVELALNFLNRIMGLRERIQAVSQAGDLHQMVNRELEEMLEELGISFPNGPQGSSM